ncbi:MAG: leucyl aminopeptidase [Flavobacteriales bacterium]|jgi:leucyl aminopeptidase
MSLRIDASPTLPDSADLVAVIVSQPFDRAASALGLPEAIAARLVEEATRTGFDGAMGSSVFVGGDSSLRWVALIGSGATPPATDYRRSGAALVRLTKQLKASSAVLLGADSDNRARFATEGVALSTYSFDRHITKTDDAQTPSLEVVTIVGADTAKGVALGRETAAAVALGRDLANEHPGACVPEFLAQSAEAIATKYGMACTIKREDTLAEEGFNLILAVGKGSANQPRLIHLVYKGTGEIERRIAFVGKGVTYDSGGYSMKPSEGQVNMHLDMGGSAAVLGAADAVGRTRPANVEVHFIVPAAENLVSRDAYKVNEIVKGYAGISVEVLNTDAEGRLILADALAYALEFEPDEIVDCATLTGACVVALGLETAGLFSSDDALANNILQAAANIDESIWRMPLTERIEAQLKSDFADTKNIGARWGGAISAALFLKKFVGDHAWAHIDLAGPAMTESEWEYINKGGTGFGVLTLHALASRFSD